jgi:hypothetical protein
MNSQEVEGDMREEGRGKIGRYSGAACEFRGHFDRSGSVYQWD